jgi:cytochrome P450
MNATKPLPELKGIPYLGHMFEMGQNPLELVSKVQKTLGDVGAFNLLGQKMVLLSNPKTVEQVFMETGTRYDKGETSNFFASGLVLGNGLISSEGDLWKRQRKLAAPAFRHSVIPEYAKVMSDFTVDMLKTWQNGGVRDMHTDMMLLTQRIVVKTLFNADVAGDAQELAQCFDTMLNAVGSEMTGIEQILPPFVPTPSRFGLKAAVEKVDKAVMEIVEERRRTNLSGERDFLALLMASRDEDGNGMSDAQILDELRTLYLAGHETTATTLSWTWSLLSQHPTVYQRLKEELATVLGDKLPTADDLRNLPYCEAIIKEALRLRPPAWVFMRAPMEDVELEGYHIPKRTLLWISPYVLHNDERWFKQASAFRPERWLNDAEKLTYKYAYCPFGGGPRICIGNGFAMLEATLLLATIAQVYDVEVLNSSQTVLQASATLRPKNGLKARVHKRNT